MSPYSRAQRERKPKGSFAYSRRLSPRRWPFGPGGACSVLTIWFLSWPPKRSTIKVIGTWGDQCLSISWRVVGPTVYIAIAPTRPVPAGGAAGRQQRSVLEPAVVLTVTYVSRVQDFSGCG